MLAQRPGFTLTEIVLAIAIGFVLLGGTIATYNNVRASSALSNARSIVGTVQTNIGMDKFRKGSPAPMTPEPSSSPANYSINSNTDSTGTAFYPNTTANALPPDPIYNSSVVQKFDSSVAATPLAAGDPTDRWDNPIFASPGGNPAFGKGGWLYDEKTGAFRINLSNHDYPADRPGAW